MSHSVVKEQALLSSRQALGTIGNISTDPLIVKETFEEIIPLSGGPSTKSSSNYNNAHVRLCSAGLQPGICLSYFAPVLYSAQMAAFVRKNIRLPAANYIGKRIYFVTICCHNRRPILRDTNVVSSMLSALSEISRHHEFSIHAYCFMPNHLHLLCDGLSDQSRLLDFVSRFKQHTAFEYHKNLNAPLWQERSYDHILRKADAMENVAWYIWMNPVRKGLCTDPKAFPFSGSLTMSWNLTNLPSSQWAPPWKKPKMPG
jgi:putative transposase